jgi:hypothetical protein
MIMNKRFCFLLALFLGNTAYPAQFINLDFESVILPLPEPDPLEGTVPAELAVPGWQVPVIGCQSDAVLYNSFYLSLAGVSLYSRSYDPFDVIQGNFSVLLYSGLVCPLPTGADATIAQTGLVPYYARSLEIKVSRFPVPFSVMLGGESISMMQMSTGPNFLLFAGDISAHAGLEQELRITVPYVGTAPRGQAYSVLIDDIVFSRNLIPEPRAWALGGMAVLIYASRRLLRKVISFFIHHGRTTTNCSL